MPRRIALRICVMLALNLVACGSEQPPSSAEPTSPPSATIDGRGESPLASPEPSAVPSCEPSPTAESGGLTGVWEANDDGIYYLRETSDGRLWWFGTDVGRTTGNTFSNVAVGQIDGDVIRLEWVDVPYGHWRNGGRLTLRVSADRNTLTRTSATGGFGGSIWTRQLDCASRGAS